MAYMSNKKYVIVILSGITFCSLFLMKKQTILTRKLQVDLSARFNDQKEQGHTRNGSTIPIQYKEYNRLRAAEKELTLLRNQHKTIDDRRLCKQNPFVPSLSKSLAAISSEADNWIANQTEIMKDIQFRSNGEHTHTRFEAFEELASCDYSCVGGECNADRSKIICGLSTLNNDQCVVYSVGSNNVWEFENEILQKTPCVVHTFDCTGPRSRFEVPKHERLHFHHICLGSKPIRYGKPKDVGPAVKDGAVNGDIMTLHQIQKMLNHKRIDLLKFDIEGYEWPLIESWPLLSDPLSRDYVLPYQITFELHYYTGMKDLALNHLTPFKFETDMVRLASRLIKLGYATIVRDNNRFCKHCTELTSIRFRCPEEV